MAYVTKAHKNVIMKYLKSILGIIFLIIAILTFVYIDLYLLIVSILDIIDNGISFLAVFVLVIRSIVAIIVSSVFWLIGAFLLYKD